MKAVLASMLFLISFTARGEDTFQPATLKETMKAMSSRIKTVNANVSNPQENQKSAILVDEFVVLASQAQTFTPDSIASLPASEQAAAKGRFVQLLGGVVTAAKNLSQALRDNDNSKAKNILNDLADQKKEGHSEFRFL